MTPDEAKIFENDPLFADSLLIRKYDELAKIENMKINVSCERLLRRVFHIDASQLTANQRLASKHQYKNLPDDEACQQNF